MRKSLLTTALAAAVISCASHPSTPASVARPEGAPSRRVVGLEGRPFGIAISSQGIVLVTQQDANSVARFRLGADKPDAMITVGRDPGDVVFTSDGSKAFVSAFVGGGLHVIDVLRGIQTTSLRVGGTAYRLAIAPDDSRLYVTSTNGKVYIVDPSRPAVIDSARLGGSLQGIALSTSGKTLVVTSTTGGVWKLNALTLEVLRNNVIPGGLQDVAIRLDESEIYVANEKAGVQILDGQTLARHAPIPMTDFEAFGLALTPDEHELYLTSPSTGAARIVDIRTRTVLFTLNLGGSPRRIAFDKSGRTALIANERSWVDVIK